MQAKQAPPRLPGTSASTPYLVNAIGIGGLVVLLWVPLIGLITAGAIQSSGHLPWPVAQWALTTPAGVLATFAAIALIAGPSLIAAQRRILRRRYLARAVDVTEVPPWVWLTRPPVYPGETRADRWLGRGRKARMTSLTLLGVAALVALLFLAGFFASAVLGLIYIPRTECGARGCPPQYPVLPLLLASEFVTLGLSSWAQYRWLRRVEASSGVWLRLRDWFAALALFYIRKPGVTHEAAQAALARFAPAEAMPLARVYAISVLAAIPLLLMFIVGLFLQFWLPAQWIPR
jgi:hypothetical protein